MLVYTYRGQVSKQMRRKNKRPISCQSQALLPSQVSAIMCYLCEAAKSKLSFGNLKEIL